VAALELVNKERRKPVSQVSLRCEPREIGSAGQQGFDYGVHASDHDFNGEIKIEPQFEDVEEFLAKAKRLVADGTTLQFRLVSGSASPAQRALEALLRHAREATSTEHLCTIVEAQRQSAAELRLLRDLGEDALQILRQVECEFATSRELATQRDALLMALAARDSVPALEATVTKRLELAMRTREAIPVAGLLEELFAQKVLLPAEAVDLAGSDPDEVLLLALLDTCRTAVPVAHLAFAADVSEHRVLDLLQAYIDNAAILHTADGLWLPSASVQFSTSGSGGALARLLDRLLADAAAKVPGVALHARNVLALAESQQHDRPDLVARAFVTFDKPAKAYGDLALVFRLATISDNAATDLAERGAANDAENRRLLDLRSRNKVCGTSWVLQRRGELDQASHQLIEARELAEKAGDARSSAFADKCEGRVERTRAELLPAGDRRDELLARSRALLVDARAQFAGLYAQDLGLQEELGECSSLLARTAFVEGNLPDARVQLAEAHRLLDTLPQSKAWADMVILEADIARRDHIEGLSSGSDGAQTALKLSDAVGTLEVVLERTTTGLHPEQDRSNSEIAARALIALGHLQQELGRVDLAEQAWRAAVDCYQALKQPHLGDAAELAILELNPDTIPDPLRHVLEERRASPSVTLAAIAGLPTDAPPGTLPGADDPSWQQRVDAAERSVAARSRSWVEQDVA